MIGKKGFGRVNHILIALGVVAALYFANQMYKWIVIPVDNNFLLQIAIITLIYANMPDIDQPGSKINKYAVIALVGVILYSFFNVAFKTYGVLAAVIIGLLEFINHREFVHSLVGGALIAAPLLYLGVVQFAVGLIAFMSHIVAEGEFSFLGERK